MQTNLADFIRNTPDGDEADAILRNCVHCGFCTATCPTYQLLGDELDGPRGRIYLIKQMVEGAPVTRSTQIHLDRCLTCRACETTCPSGVQYGRLVEIGRKLTEEKVTRPLGQRLTRRLPATFVLKRSSGIHADYAYRPTYPPASCRKTARQGAQRGSASPGIGPTAKHPRKMLMLSGLCATVDDARMSTSRRRGCLMALGVEVP